MFGFISDLIWWAWLFWTWTYIWWLMVSRNKEARSYRFLQETKQAFKVLIVLKMAIPDIEMFLLDGSGYWLPIIWGSDMLWYIFIRDIDDDDRWKKRRKKAAAKVKEMAGRLVVVPEPIPVTGK